MQTITGNDGINFFVSDNDNDGFVVVYKDKTGQIIWSEFYRTKKKIRAIYQREIARGQFDGSQNGE